MKLFGFELSLKRAPDNLQAVTSYVPASWWGGPIRESFAGAWQKNVTIESTPNLFQNSTLYACVGGIAGDIANLRPMLSRDVDGVWEEVRDPHGNANEAQIIGVLEQPNHYQNPIQFLEHWIISKLLCGNTYVLKERNAGGKISRLYILNHKWVTPLEAEDGSIYYRLGPDYLSQVDDAITVPASEIIHDRMTPLFHPLIGVSPIYACAVTGTMAAKIQQNSTNQFANLSRPGGMLTAPQRISDDTAARLKSTFESNFSGSNYGRLFVAGDGLKFEPIALSAETSQLIEQLQFTVEDIIRAFHYPHWKVGGPVPAYSNGPDAITTQYYKDCLQPHIESIEKLLEKGLELPNRNYHVELDLEALFRMDTKALFESNSEMVRSGWGTPNEARFRANLKAIPGGDVPFMQEQQYPVPVLAERTDSPKNATQPTVPEPPPMPEPPKAKSLTLKQVLMAKASLRERLAT